LGRGLSGVYRHLNNFSAIRWLGDRYGGGKRGQI